MGEKGRRGRAASRALLGLIVSSSSGCSVDASGILRSGLENIAIRSSNFSVALDEASSLSGIDTDCKSRTVGPVE